MLKFTIPLMAAIALSACSALEQISETPTDSNGKACSIYKHTNSGIYWTCPDGTWKTWRPIPMRGMG